MNAAGQNLNATHYQSNLMSWVIRNAVLEAAFAEVIKSREHDSHNSDIWGLRRNWPAQQTTQNRPPKRCSPPDTDETTHERRTTTETPANHNT